MISLKKFKIYNYRMKDKRMRATKRKIWRLIVKVMILVMMNKMKILINKIKKLKRKDCNSWKILKSLLELLRILIMKMRLIIRWM